MAAGVCTAPDIATGSQTCTGAFATNAGRLTVYDAAAQFQPINGSNLYIPANPAFPATGYNPNPPTTVITIDQSASFTFVNPTTAQLADRGIIAANFSNSEDPPVNNIEIDNKGTISLSTNSFSANGRLHDIVADSQVNLFTVNNFAGGLISIAQSGVPGALSVTSAGIAAPTLQGRTATP